VKWSRPLKACIVDAWQNATSFVRGRGNGWTASGGCAQMQLRGYHLGAAAALETRENADAAAAGVADRHDAVFDRDTAFALALLA
jgi:hypothetical protein